MWVWDLGGNEACLFFYRVQDVYIYVFVGQLKDNKDSIDILFFL